MLKSKIIPSLFFMIYFSALGSLIGQSNVSGKLVDAETNEALIGGYVKLNASIDSTVYFGATNFEGKFIVEVVKAGTYEITISYIGYQPFQKKMNINGATDLGQISLKINNTYLDEVEVVAIQERVSQQGDTTIYHAAAYGTNPNAAAEDLLQKMPGFVITNGKLQVQGENINKIVVNGKPFFEDDPEMALKNLPAEVISKIQVYDQSSEEEEEEASNNDGAKTINIVLKEKFENSVFGNVYGGYGYEDKYKSGVNVNIFKPNRSLNILSQSNNINQQNFSATDLLGASSKGGLGRRGRGGINRQNFLVPQNGGINTTNAAGINYQEFWGKKIQLSASYFFNQSESINEIFTRNEFFNTASPNTLEENANDNSENINHRINAKFRFKIDDKNTIQIKPRLTIQKNLATSDSETQTFSSNILTNTLNNLLNSDLNSIIFSNRVEYTRRFDKMKRSIKLYFNNNNSKSNGQTFTNAININSILLENSVLDQNAILDNSKNNYTTGIRFSEPVGIKASLSFAYNYSNEQSDAEILTFAFNESNQAYDALAEDLSSLFNTDYLAHKGQLSYKYRSKKVVFTLRGNYQSAQLKSQQDFPESTKVKKVYKNFLPDILFQFNLGRSTNFRIGFKSTTQLPKITDLQNVINNNDPLRIRAGNADLDQQIKHSLNARYTRNNTEKGSVFTANLKSSFHQNYIGRNLIIAAEPDTIKGVVLQQGAQFRAPINLSGYLNTRFFVSYGVPLQVLKSNFNINFGANHKRIPSQIDGTNFFTNTEKLTAGVKLSSNISSELEFTIKTTSTFDFAQNSNSNNTQIFNQLTQAKINYIFGGHWQVNSAIIQQYYHTFGAEPVDDIIFWNASFGYKFLENNRAEINLTLYDILNSNTSIGQTYQDNVFTQKQSLALTRYFMLSFRYNIRKFRE